MATRKNQSHHDSMVRKATDFLAGRGLVVQADVSPYPRPEKITWQGQTSGHIPDVQTPSHNIEVETENSIDDFHTTDQWKLFAAFADQSGREFWIGIPNGWTSAAKNRLNQLRLDGKIWEL